MSPTITSSDAFRTWLQDREIHLNPLAFERALRRIGELAGQTRNISEEKLREIAEEAASADEALDGVANSFR